MFVHRHLTQSSLLYNLCHLCTKVLTRALFSFHHDRCVPKDPKDYSSSARYNMTFRQTTFTDGGQPAPTTLSSPISNFILDDDVFEGVEYFQVRILETSDPIRVRIGLDTVNVMITDGEPDSRTLFALPSIITL